MIKHYFFGRECEINKELSDHANLERALQKDNTKFLAINFVNQIHSNEVLIIDDVSKIHGKTDLPKADAIVTNVSGLAISVVTADCSPILLQDSQAKIIAAIHAGWRGAKSGIIQNAILEMKKLGAKTSSIQAFIGPMIQQRSYQVGQEFYDEFIAQDEKNKDFFIENDVEQKYLFDLPSYVKRTLQQQEIEKIEDVNIDTYSNYDKFASYRKSCHLGINKGGRNISLIIIE